VLNYVHTYNLMIYVVFGLVAQGLYKLA